MKQGWQIKRIGEVASIVNGGTPSTSIPKYWDGGIEWLTPKDMGKLTCKYVSCGERTISQEGVDNSSAKILPPYSVILSSRAPIGYVAINTLPMSTNQGCKGLIPSKSITAEYLLYFLLKSTKLLNDLGTGATFKELSGGKLGEILIPVPSISEQQRIVALLDAEFAKIDALKANAEKNLQNAKDLFQAALKKELEPKEGWITKTLGEVCDVQCGSTPLRSEPLFWENGTYPWFTVDDIREQGRVITDTKQKITKLAWDKLRVFPANSVLLCCTASVGEYAITTIPLTSNQQFNGLTIKKGIDITPMYLFHFASTLKEKLLKLSGKATIDFVSGTKVKSIEIAFPPVIDQQSIVARLDVLNDKCKTLQANYEKTLSLCDDLKQSLLRKAFNGEI